MKKKIRPKNSDLPENQQLYRINFYTTDPQEVTNLLFDHLTLPIFGYCIYKKELEDAENNHNIDETIDNSIRHRWNSNIKRKRVR